MSSFHADENIVLSYMLLSDSSNPIVRLFQTACRRILDATTDHYSI
jgi:hypothetical protein